jgi:mono/diheme cytochrome c family protein
MKQRQWIGAIGIACALAIPAFADGNRDAVLAEYAKQAKAADSGFAGFSVAGGKKLFGMKFNVNPDTPSCSACHTSSPLNSGKTRAGKAIDPMAVSANPKRFTDIAVTEKWFGRNCKSVIGRECTPREKGDFITYLSGL